MLESLVEQDLVRWAQDNGALCLKVAVASCRGFPDRLLVLPNGEVAFVELKRPGGGRVSPQQRDMLQQLRDRGQHAIVADNLEDILDAIDFA